MRRWRHQGRAISWTVTAAGVAIVLSVLVSAVLRAPSEPPRAAVTSPPKPSAPSIVRSPSSPAAIVPHGGLRIVRTTDANGWVVLPDGFGTWVAGAGTLTRIDPQTGATRVTAHGSWDYDYVRLAEHGEGSIVITVKGKLLTLDAGSGTVISRTNLSSLGVLDAVLSDNPSAFWVAASGEDGSQVLAKIDDDTGKVVRRVDGIGQGLHVLAWAGGYVFVSSNGGNGPTLLRVDPHTLATTRVRGAPPGERIAGIGRHLWMTGYDNVHCLDAFTLESCGAVDIPGLTRVAADGHDLWVLSVPIPGRVYIPGEDRRPTITLVNGRNGNVVAGPMQIRGSQPASIAAFQGRAWVGHYRTGTITEIARCGAKTCRDRRGANAS